MDYPFGQIYSLLKFSISSSSTFCLPYHHQSHEKYIETKEYEARNAEGPIPENHQHPEAVTHTKLKQLTNRSKSRHAKFIRSYIKADQKFSNTKIESRIKKYRESQMFKKCMANEAKSDLRCNRYAFICVFCS